jgi:acyl dehydratase
MRIDSSFAGTPLREFRTKASWRQTMNYAAAVNGSCQAYFDDERPGGIIAHPMNCAALTWPVTGNVSDFIESENFPKELIARQVHYTEHLEFHRPVVPGDELLIKGRVAAIEPHRAGSHVIIRFDASGVDGAPVFTEHIGGLMRGVECEGGVRGIDSVPAVPENTTPGTLWESGIAVEQLAPFIYDGCSDIVFPIHTSKKFARAVGLPGIILQGTATLAYAVNEIIEREAGSDPARLSKLYCRFTDMVMPGTLISVRITGRIDTDGGTDIFFEVLNREGRKAVNKGYAQIKK